MTNATAWLLMLLVLLVALVGVIAGLYQRATREVSLVRTGAGGRKVIMDGGCVAIPYFHEISRVNMQTLRLEIARAGEAALITKDRLRVDVAVEFYVSVLADADGVARAAQTLGGRTFHPDKLRELIEGKLVDALRSVAARMSMDELHENRGAFVLDVRAGLGEALARNGLELDSVSLSALDQTPFKALDENNAFNAVGMRKLAEVIARSKKERAEIDADADVSVRQAAMQAAKRKLQIDLEEQQAQIAQVQQIETLKAAQMAEIVRHKADSEGASTRARIQMEQEIRAADIGRERAIELANQDRQIAIALKSREESGARAAADAARAEAVKAAEAILTAREVAEAERRKEIALLAALQEAEIGGQRVRMAAQAEKDAAIDRARARVEEAKGEADAGALRSAATRQRLIAEAEGKRAQVDAENAMSAPLIAMKIELAKLEALPKVVAEMVKPAEKIDSIRIHHVTGLGSAATAQAGGAGAKPAVNQALDSIMEMAVQLPALKKIGEELGMSMEGGLAGVTGNLLTGTPAAGGKAQGKSADKARHFGADKARDT